jgi:hypothetical protein
MRARSHPPAHQRALPFARPDLWDQIPEAIRHQCQDLCWQLLQTVIESEELLRREYEREDQA